MAKGKVQVDITAKDEASKKLENVSGKGMDLRQTFNKVALAATAMALAVTAALGKMLHDWSTTGDEVAKMANRTGWAVESISEMSYIAEQSGTSLNAFETAARRLSRTLVDATEGSEASARAFGRLGLNVDDLRGLDIEEQFWRVAMALSEMGDETERSATAQELFGRSGTELLPMLSQGADGIQEMMERFQEFGYVWTEESAQAAEAFRDSLHNMETAIDQLKFALVEGMAEPLTMLVNNHLRPAITEFSRFIKENEELTDQVIAFARGLGWVIDQLVKLIDVLQRVDMATPDWLAKFSPLSLISGRTGREAGAEYRAWTGQSIPEAPGLMPGIADQYGAMATQMLRGDTNITINGNFMGDEESIRQLAQVLEPALTESMRGTSFPHVNTSGYFGGNSAR